MPATLIQEPRSKVSRTSALRSRCRFAEGPATSRPRMRLDNRVYPKAQNVDRNPAMTPNNVQYREMPGPFCVTQHEPQHVRPHGMDSCRCTACALACASNERLKTSTNIPAIHSRQAAVRAFRCITLFATHAAAFEFQAFAVLSAVPTATLT